MASLSFYPVAHVRSLGYNRKSRLGREEHLFSFRYAEFEVPAKYSGGELSWICLSGATDLAVLGISVVIQPGRWMHLR